MSRMTVEEWPEKIDEILDGVKSIMKAKNQDYTAGSGDPFANFRGAGSFGMDPLAGLCLRMDDKFQRVKAYFQNGELAVEGEGLEDAFKDIIGYSVIALGMLDELKKSSEPSFVHDVSIPIDYTVTINLPKGGSGGVDKDILEEKEAEDAILDRLREDAANLHTQEIAVRWDKIDPYSMVIPPHIQYNFSPSSGVDRQEDSTEPKPSWKNAPSWANWLAMDEDGEWFWFESKPYIFKEKGGFGVWTKLQGKVVGAKPCLGRKQVAHTSSWEQSLEERPIGL